jgi:hypothetical protein
MLLLTIQEKAKPDKKSGTENQRVQMRTAGCLAKQRRRFRMKKYLGLLTSLLLFFFATGNAMAITFTDEQILHKLLGLGANSGEYSWSHETPADLEVPWDTVNSASLEVWAYLVDGNNDVVSVGTITGTLTNSLTWSWQTWSFADTHLNMDVAEAFDPWSESILDVTLSWNESGCLNTLYLDRSLLTIDYDNGSAPVPEPASMLLLGTGFVGLAGFSRRKLKK